jgi:hypothetical protein
MDASLPLFAEGPSFLAFDMEIATPVPDGADLLAHKPGISCAAFMRETDRAPQVLFDPTESPGLFVAGTKALTKEGATRLLDVLLEGRQRGETVLTWNGAGFDFRLLAAETGRHADCAMLARESVDMMFQVLCERGHPLALDTALKGMALATKTHSVTLNDGRAADIDGARAPQLWQDGEYRAVMTYCGNDAATTLSLALACAQTKRLSWTSRAGKPSSMPLSRGWLTVTQCLGLPKPDTSWMTSPMTRESVVGWMEQQ